MSLVGPYYQEQEVNRLAFDQYNHQSATDEVLILKIHSNIAYASMDMHIVALIHECITGGIVIF